MRPSRILKKLHAGQVASCSKTYLSDPRVVEIAAMCGFDCVWLDMEHVPTDWATVENQVRAAKISDCDTMVRVARASYSSHIKPFEAEAAGIMVPHLMSLEDAKKVVWQTRFHPVCRRAVDGGNADGAHCLIDFDEYISTANIERFVVVQIEDPEPLKDLAAICELPGIDMVFLVPEISARELAALANGIIRLLQKPESVLLKWPKKKEVRWYCGEHGKPAGTHKYGLPIRQCWCRCSWTVDLFQANS
jgi:4-hydroxy-2-oxoheptanedioate aldolase